MRIIITGFLLLLAVSSIQAAYITDKLVAGLYKEAKVSDKPIKALNSGTPLEVVSRENGFVKVRTSDGVIGWVESTYLTDEKPARSILLDTQAKLSILQKKMDKLSKPGDSDKLKAVEEISSLQEKLAQSQGKVSQLEIQLKAARLSGDKLDESKELLEREKQQLVADMQQENTLLKQQIKQVADILGMPANIPVSTESHTQMNGSETGQGAAALPAELGRVLSGTGLWISALVILILGFVGGYYFMHYRVRQRFGPMFRL
jgi:SH3 domain protein